MKQPTPSLSLLKERVPDLPRQKRSCSNLYVSYFYTVSLSHQNGSCRKVCLKSLCGMNDSLFARIPPSLSWGVCVLRGHLGIHGALRRPRSWAGGGLGRGWPTGTFPPGLASGTSLTRGGAGRTVAHPLSRSSQLHMFTKPCTP